MNNFIFKSRTGLIKNSPTTVDDLMRCTQILLEEQRRQRSDLHEISLKIQKLMIDKHLQMQVDEYFDHDETSPQTDSDDKRDLD